MAFWLMKTEPTVYSYDDLERAGRDLWDGVRNAAAARNMRAMRPGDLFLFYHTGDERQAVGLAHVVRTAYPDPNASDPKIIVIDVEVNQRLPNPVTLSQIKADPRFAESPLVRMGRLSVVALTDEQYAAILELAKL